MDDATFARLWASRGDEYSLALHGYALERWNESGKVLLALREELNVEDGALLRPWLRGAVSGTGLAFEEYRQQIGFFLLLVSSISLLFFLAAGNLLYFKLFTDLRRDRQQFEALHKVGIRVAEIQQIIARQVFVLFFAPFVLAAAHSAVFIEVLARVSGLSLWRPLLVVAAIYLVLHGSYYLVTRQTYARALLEGR